MHSTVSQLASLVAGRVHGATERIVHAARPLQEAGPDAISFVENERHLKHLKSCRAAALVVPAGLVARILESDPGFALIEVADPLAAFVVIYRQLEGEPPAPPAGISPQASIHPSAKIGPGCTVMPFAVLSENVEIGERCTLYPGVYIGPGSRLGDEVVLHPQVVLYAGSLLGHRVIIHANSVIGSDGFGYRFAGGKHVKVPHLGHVEIGDDVEIGACTTIDRGTFQATRIGAGTKIDNLVQIAHNCTLGRHNLHCAQVGIAGSARTGDHVIMGGGAGIADHAEVGDRTVVGARSGVHNDVEADQRRLGVPARSEREMRRIWATMGYLPEMWRELRQLKQQMEALSPPPQQERKAG